MRLLHVQSRRLRSRTEKRAPASPRKHATPTLGSGGTSVPPKFSYIEREFRALWYMAMEYADVGVGRDDCELPEVITEVHNTRVGLREFDGADCNSWLRDS